MYDISLNSTTTLKPKLTDPGEKGLKGLTTLATWPQRLRTSSSTVCARGALRLISTAITPNSRICGGAARGFRVQGPGFRGLERSAPSVSRVRLSGAQAPAWARPVDGASDHAKQHRSADEDCCSPTLALEGHRGHDRHQHLAARAWAVPAAQPQLHTRRPRWCHRWTPH